MEEQARLHVAVERRLLAHTSPRRDDDQHQDENRCHPDDHEHRGGELDRELPCIPCIIAAARGWRDHRGAPGTPQFVAGRRIALLLAVVTAMRVCCRSRTRRRRHSPVGGAVPTSRRGTGRISSPASRSTWSTRIPRTARTASATWSRAIVRDLAGVDTWWRSQDPLRTPRFDLADVPRLRLGVRRRSTCRASPLTFDSARLRPRGRRRLRDSSR